MGSRAHACDPDRVTALLYVLGVLLFVIGIGASIALHEVGHLLPAKRFGVKVTQYMVGFGPTLWSRRRGETEYGVKAVPLGGYIRMIGMFPPKPGDDPAMIRATSTGRMGLLVEQAVEQRTKRRGGMAQARRRRPQAVAGGGAARRRAPRVLPVAGAQEGRRHARRPVRQPAHRGRAVHHHPRRPGCDRPHHEGRHGQRVHPAGHRAGVPEVHPERPAGPGRRRRHPGGRPHRLDGRPAGRHLGRRPRRDPRVRRPHRARRRRARRRAAHAVGHRAVDPAAGAVGRRHARDARREAGARVGRVPRRLLAARPGAAAGRLGARRHRQPDLARGRRRRPPAPEDGRRREGGHRRRARRRRPGQRGRCRPRGRRAWPAATTSSSSRARRRARRRCCRCSPR
nr:site-2 protease family protein [Angustibacter aerolatus]